MYLPPGSTLPVNYIQVKILHYASLIVYWPIGRYEIVCVEGVGWEGGGEGVSDNYHWDRAGSGSRLTSWGGGGVGGCPGPVCM